MKLPEDFVHTMHSLLQGESDAFFRALDEPASTTIRLNPFKVRDISALPELTSYVSEPLPWASNAYYLSTRPSFTLDPLLHAGCYYVQEAASMFMEQIVSTYIDKPVRALDLCAAPGGKSTHLASILPEGSLLVCNEVIRSRSAILTENIIKWGNPAVVVTNNDPSEIGKIPAYFDIILADVPCSGEGMFRKDKEAVHEWSPGTVKLCADRQKRIISDVWDSLKPGGLLIYSTCTYNTEENEENIRWISKVPEADILDITIEPDWQISSGKKYDFPVFRFFPHKTKGEGFFIAVLRKKEPEHFYSFKEKNKHSRKKRDFRLSRKKLPIPSEIYNQIIQPDAFFFENNHNTITAIPALHHPDINLLKESLHVVHTGIRIGEIKGKDIVPDHQLAMSGSFNKQSFPPVEVDKNTALAFLKKESLQLPDETPKKFVTITFDGLPLGFAKNIGTRANNLYPNDWRIRKSLF